MNQRIQKIQLRHPESPAQLRKGMYKAQEPQRRHRSRESNVVALERDLHPLDGLRSAYYVSMGEPLDEIASPLRRLLIRLIYFRWDWYSGQSVHDMGIFTDREVAEEIATRKRTETGKQWSVKELPVNGLLPEIPVRYGFYAFPGSDADARYRNRRIKLEVVETRDLKLVNELKNQVDQFSAYLRTG